MKLGTLDIQGNTWLAPMAGVTDWAFRCVCRELGAAVTVTEMVSSRALVYHDKKSLRLLRKIGSTMDLEIPKPDDEREEQQADEALQQHKPAFRRLIAFGFKLYCFHWGPPTGAPSCCIAKQTASAALGECFRRAAASCREE